MAKTTTDVELTTAWVDVHALSGIDADTPIGLQNKSGLNLLVVQVESGQPGEDSVSGVLVHKYPAINSFVSINPDAGMTTWARALTGKAIICVTT
jgi:hypothetical protein